MNIRSISPAHTGSASPGSRKPPSSASKSSATSASSGVPRAQFHNRTYQARGLPAASRPSIVSVGPCSASSGFTPPDRQRRSEEHTSELQSLMRHSYAVFCLKKKTKNKEKPHQPKELT